MLMESQRLGIPVGLSRPLGCPRALWLLMLLLQSTAPHWDEGWDTAASWSCLSPRLSHCRNCSEIFAMSQCQRICMGQKLLGCEAPQGQAVADRGQKTPPAASCPHGHAAKELHHSSKTKLPLCSGLSTALMGPWATLHQPDPLQVTLTPHLKQPPGPQAPWHTQGQVQPLAVAGVLWLAQACVPTAALRAAAGVQSSGYPINWADTRVGKGNPEPQVSSPCTISV